MDGIDKWFGTRFYHFQHLGDDVAGALHQYRGANADLFFRDIIFIVQGSVGDHDAAHGNGRQTGNRGQFSGAANLNINILNHGLGLFSGKFMGNGPARGAGGGTKALLPIQAVHFVNDAVDVIGPAGAASLHFAMVGHQLVDRGTYRVRLHLEAPSRHCPQHATVAVAGQVADLAPGVGAEA